MTQEITFASIDELSSLIRGGELSPVEVTDAAFERIQETEPKLNAFLELFEEGARSAAREAEAEITAGRYRGPLHGVPVGLKDLVDVAGSPTTGGSPLFQQNVARTDATITSRFRQAGAIIIGKTNLVMHAMGATGLNPYTGHPHNPWDLERCTGGSSSGSGAAVAAGLPRRGDRNGYRRQHSYAGVDVRNCRTETDVRASVQGRCAGPQLELRPRRPDGAPRFGLRVHDERACRVRPTRSGLSG